MSEDQKAQDAANDIFPADWREQVRLYGGRKGFIRQELKRLGFWPPKDPSVWKTQKEEAELDVLYEELKKLRVPLIEVEDKITAAGDFEALIAEVRQKRIERRRIERAAQKEQREQARAAKRANDQQWRQSSLPHLGRGVSSGLKFEGGDDEKLRSLGLPLLPDAAQIAAAMQIAPRDLAFLCYHRGAATLDHYRRFTIPKKRGGVRHISAPKPRLRHAQSWLLANVLAALPVHEAAMAFRPARSIVDNARAHAGRAVIVRLDLKDFFPSINFRRVKKLFQSFGYNEGVATIFALLSSEAPRAEVTLDGQKRFVALSERYLPQGACTSPAITNLLCRHLDKRLSGAAARCNFIYTRYADDLIFSAAEAGADAASMLDFARKIVATEKFVVNDEKTAILRRRGRQAVTGLVVNNESTFGGAPRVGRSEMRRFRAFLHQYQQVGREEMTKRLGQDAQAYAAGYLSFIHMVNPQQETKIRRAHPWLERWGEGAA